MLAAVTAVTAGVGWLAVHAVGGPDPGLTPRRRLLGRPDPHAVVAIGLGVVIALVSILPAIGRPDELVDSPDAVYHLNRIRLFLDTGNLSIVHPTFYPNGFHSWIATGSSGSTAPAGAAVTDRHAATSAGTAEPVPTERIHRDAT